MQSKNPINGKIKLNTINTKVNTYVTLNKGSTKTFAITPSNPTLQKELQSTGIIAKLVEILMARELARILGVFIFWSNLVIDGARDIIANIHKKDS